MREALVWKALRETMPRRGSEQRKVRTHDTCVTSILCLGWGGGAVGVPQKQTQCLRRDSEGLALRL